MSKKSIRRMIAESRHEEAGNDCEEGKPSSNMRPAGPGFVTDGLYLYSTREVGPREDQSDPMYLGLPP